MRKPHNSYPFIIAMSIVSGLTGCAQQAPFIPGSLTTHKKADTVTSTNAAKPKEGAQPNTLQFRETPKPPLASKISNAKPQPEEVPKSETADITLAFDQIPLPTFIQVVYGSILKKNFSIDPQISQRQDMVTLRTGTPQTASQVAATSKMLLKSYGIAVTDVGGFVRVVPDNNFGGYAPEIRRGRALPDVPLPLRPVFQLVELNAVRTNEVSGWIRQMFGNRVQLQEDASRNAVMLSGQSDDVIAALEAIHVLDQPLMRGRNSLRINPVFWSSEELKTRLTDVMVAEGYAVGAVVNFIALPNINALLVFANDSTLLKHIEQWTRELDKPLQSAGISGGYFSYPVKYADAADLAKTLQEVLNGPNAKKQTRIVVNPGTNALIIQGGQDEYSQIMNLLKEIDKPTKAALIEATVAEVSLDDLTQLGVEWQMADAVVNGATITAATLGGLGIGSGGLTVKRLANNGDVRAVLNALATNNKARILSTPRVVARNGDGATIQVGEEVPIITSQQTTPTTGNTGVLQTVQYRSTGVILKVKPVIHAGDRVELDIQQEVSSAKSTTTGVTVSPTISSRRVETKLSVRDGATVMLAGLISSQSTDNESGVPLLKDIPILGQAFRVNSKTEKRTELIVLITPYVLNDDQDAQSITDSFRGQLGEWARPVPVPVPQKNDAGEPSKAAQPPAAPASTIEPAPPNVVLEQPPSNKEAAVPDVEKATLETAEQATKPPAKPAATPITDPKLLEELKAAIQNTQKSIPANEVKKSK